MDPIWTFLGETLRSEGRARLMVVVDHSGSTPGRQGFKMAVAAGGGLCGTIGGGIMEHRLVEQARAEMQGPPIVRLITRTHRRKAPPEQRSGMICAGTQRLALLDMERGDLAWVETLTALRGAEATWSLSPAGAKLRADDLSENGRKRSFVERDGDWLYQERVGRPDTVYIVGGGHVGLALSRVLVTLDLQLVLFDHRAQVETLLANHYVQQKHIVPYTELNSLIPEGLETYVVIVSTGFESDAEALWQVIHKRIKYLGLMGSAAKIGRIFERLRERGSTADQLARVRAPIGLQLNNRTPAEIAVSIAGEIIAVRNGAPPPWGRT